MERSRGYTWRARWTVLAALMVATGAVTREEPRSDPRPVEVVAPAADALYSVSQSTGNPALLISRAYGVDHAHEIEALAFSFNIQYGDDQMRREWLWDVADNRIEYRGEGPTGLPISLVYHRDKMDSGDPVLNRRVDEQFVDDQYWLLFPFHLSWERELETAYQPVRPMYIEPRDSECLSVRYPASTGGGDTYEIFFGPDKLIREWAYRPGNQDMPAFVTTWERHAKAGPVLFSLMHRSDDGAFRVWFDRVSVKLANQGWVDAEPLERFLTRADPTVPPAKNPF